MKKICANCEHSGNQFKIGKMTHLHCGHPNTEIRYPTTNDFNPWDSLREFWESCNRFEPKKKTIVFINESNEINPEVVEEIRNA